MASTSRCCSNRCSIASSEKRGSSSSNGGGSTAAAASSVSSSSSSAAATAAVAVAQAPEQLHGERQRVLEAHRRQVKADGGSSRPIKVGADRDQTMPRRTCVRVVSAVTVCLRSARHSESLNFAERVRDPEGLGRRRNSETDLCTRCGVRTRCSPRSRARQVSSVHRVLAQVVPHHSPTSSSHVFLPRRHH